MSVVAFPDVETLGVAYLTAGLAAHGEPVKVSTKVPNPRPAKLVRVTRTGGVADYPGQDHPRVTVECWAADGPAAFALARLARALMWALPADETHGRDVRKVSEVGGPAFYPDPATTSPRYQFTVELHVRGSALEET